MQSQFRHHCATAFDGRFTLKGAKAVYAPDRAYDTEHIRLEVDVDPIRQTFRAVCRTTVRAIVDAPGPMVFHAANLRIQSVRWNGKPVRYTVGDGRLTVQPPSTPRESARAEIAVAYRVVNPKLGLFFMKPDRRHPDRPVQVWTQGEDEYARHWFPCHDTPGERASTEMIATVPAGFTAVSNGRLLGSRRRRGKTTFHWRQSIPHAPYLVTLAVGRFSLIKDRWKNVPVEYYCERGREDDARRAFGKTPKMIDFFSSFIGVRYPYEKYAQVAVADFIYGGMENTSATTQTDLALLDARAAVDYSSDELVAHELAHQWFGDFLTCKDWSHAWLNESFATYFDALFKRHDRGEDEFLYAIFQNAHEYLSEDRERYRRSVVTHVYKHPTDLFDRHLYEKGSVILHMLHRELGETLFRKAIRTYVKAHAGKTVETVDLINAIESATGRNPRRFFDEWIFRAGHPTLRARTWWDARKKEAHVRIVQANAAGGEPGFFQIKTEILFRTAAGERRERVEFDGESTRVTVKLASKPDLVIIDPEHRLLKVLDFPRPEPLLIAQLTDARNPLARIEAARALAPRATPAALAALREALLRDGFWGVQVEVAGAIGSTKSDEAAGILLNSLDVVENPKVRRAIYAALREFKSVDVGAAVAERYESEESYFAMANALRTMAAVRYRRADEHLKKALQSTSWNHVLRIAALDGLAHLGGPDVPQILLRHTRAGNPQRVRMAAIRGLARYGAGGESEVHDRLIELTGDDFLLVQVAAVGVLHQIGDERSVPALRKLTSGDRDGRLMRLAEEAILKITKGFGDLPARPPQGRRQAGRRRR